MTPTPETPPAFPLLRLRWPRPDWFLTGMVVAVALAWLFPEPGARGGWLHPELLTKGGVSLVFFLHGLGISFAALRAGTLQWKLHLLVQACVFGLFPMLGGVLLLFTRGRLPEDLRLGLFFLCALPSTVSSSVALTAAARGNVPAALFNATLSSLIGVVLTPAWMTLVTESAEISFSFSEVILDLVKWLVMPLIAGQICRIWLADWAARHKKRINTVDRLTILLLIYTSFCDSVQLGVWTRHGVQLVLISLGITLVLFVVVFWTLKWICRQLQWPFPDEVAVVFCGSKKSLATGVPMANLMFGSYTGLGLILLPMMIYHPLQLLICGVLAERWRRRGMNTRDSGGSTR